MKKKTIKKAKALHEFESNYSLRKFITESFNFHEDQIYERWKQQRKIGRHKMIDLDLICYVYNISGYMEVIMSQMNSKKQSKVHSNLIIESSPTEDIGYRFKHSVSVGSKRIWMELRIITEFDYIEVSAGIEGDDNYIVESFKLPKQYGSKRRYFSGDFEDNMYCSLTGLGASKMMDKLLEFFLLAKNQLLS